MTHLSFNFTDNKSIKLLQKAISILVYDPNYRLSSVIKFFLLFNFENLMQLFLKVNRRD